MPLGSGNKNVCIRSTCVEVVSAVTRTANSKKWQNSWLRNLHRIFLLTDFKNELAHNWQVKSQVFVMSYVIFGLKIFPGSDTIFICHSKGFIRYGSVLKFENILSVSFWEDFWENFYLLSSKYTACSINIKSFLCPLNSKKCMIRRIGYMQSAAW